MRYNTDPASFEHEYNQRFPDSPEGMAAWVSKTRAMERTEIYDAGADMLKELLTHMYGGRQQFIDMPHGKISKWETDLVNFDRLSPYKEFMVAMAERLNLPLLATHPGITVGSYLREQVLLGPKA